jgi:hypothetical protein
MAQTRGAKNHSIALWTARPKATRRVVPHKMVQIAKRERLTLSASMPINLS